MEPFARTHSADRFQRLLGEQPWIADTAVAVIVFVIGVLSRPGVSFETGVQVVYSMVVLGCSAALVLRRVRPRLSLTVMALLLVVHLLVVRELGVFPAVISLIAAYTTQTQLVLPWRWLFAAAVYVGAVAAVLVSPISSLGADWWGRLMAIGVVLALLTVAILAGVVRRHRRARYALAVERAEVLEAQQQTARRLAAVEERNRIAREMHDVLGHSLNAIAAQAEGVRYVLRSDTERADQALADIGRLSRKAVDDVRDLIDVLAANDTDTTMRPMPSLRDVPELIGTLQHARATIRLWAEGNLDSVPGHVSLAAYRIIQESLTNAIKHADGAPITIRVTVENQRIDLTVLNAAALAVLAHVEATGGRGLVGMQERARALGGTVEAGPDPTTGGWRVAASLPWSRA